MQGNTPKLLSKIRAYPKPKVQIEVKNQVQIEATPLSLSIGRKGDFCPWSMFLIGVGDNANQLTRRYFHEGTHA